jgi:hypothetical protein
MLAAVPALSVTSDVLSAEVKAFVTKIPGNTNDLTIYVSDDNGIHTGEFQIKNNSDGYFYVSGYKVYVDTFGNDKIRKCYIVSYDDMQNVTSQIDLGSFDYGMYYQENHHFVDSDGNPVEIELSYTPSVTPTGSTTNDATVGTWTSSYNAVIVNMSYRFDVGRSGAQWTISNGRDHAYSGLFTRYKNPSLKITRGTSTAIYPAEINARVEWEKFDNQWVGPLASGSSTMRTEINSAGKMTLWY